jgi:hypothetical protein
MKLGRAGTRKSEDEDLDDSTMLFGNTDRGNDKHKVDNYVRKTTQ